MYKTILLNFLPFVFLFSISTNIYGIEEKNLLKAFNIGANVTAKPTTCVNNGSITVIANGGSGSPTLYIFTLTDGPTSNGQTYPTSDQYDDLEFTFNDLYPGTYQVTVEDANDSGNSPYIQSITVIDNAENLNFSLLPEDPDCPNTSTGSLEVNISSGVGPYQYQILTGPSGTTTGLIPSSDGNYTFNNLPEGEYYIRVYDICGDYQTRSYVLSDPSLPSLNLYSSGNPTRERITCTEAIYKVGGAGGTGFGTFTYEVVGGAPSGYESTNNTGVFTLPIANAPYTFQVTDACGQTATYTHSNPSSYLQWSAIGRDCGGWSLQIQTNWMVGPFTYTLLNVPATYSGPMSNNTGDFYLPYGYVRYSVTDACGTVRYGSTTRTQEPIQINASLTTPTIDYCEEGKGRVQIRYNNSSNGAVNPVSFELTTVPSGFTGNAGPQGGSTFSGLIPGNYVVTASDACGNTDTHSFNIVDVLEVDVQANVNIGCVNSSSIDVSVTSNNSYHNSGTRRYRLYDANTGNLVKSGTIYGIAPNTYTFSNVSSGEYYAEFYSSSTCRYQSETIIVTDYVQPLIEKLSIFSCTSNSSTATISGIVQGGAEPYTFYLINNANNQVLETNNDCYFTNQNPSLSYSVRIEDNCGNSNSTQVTPVSTGLGLNLQGKTCAAVGEDFNIFLKRYRGMSYTWTFPDGSTYNGHDPRSEIGTIDINDFGVYTVFVTTLDGCRTQSFTLNFNNCPPPSIDFDGVDDFISAPTSFNISKWPELTIQFWVKANTVNQTSAGIIGQEGVLEITKGSSLEYSIKAQGNTGTHSKAKWLDDADTWQHITIVYDRGNIKTYYNGELEYIQPSTGITLLNNSSNTFNIGGRIKSTFPSNHFHGWIDEVRVFNVALTESQLQQIIYQEIEENNGFVKGSVIPKDVEDFETKSKISWSNLKLYYRMGTSFTNDDRVIDYSGNGNHGTIHNITTWQEETAPIPFETKQDGNWEDASTWLYGDVWDTASGINFPNVNDSDNTNCAIIKIHHDVYLDYDNFYNESFPTAESKNGLTQIGLFIDQNKTLTVAGDNHIENLSYLELNGTLDLQGDSQLVQTRNSDLVTSASGKILRRQEGNSSVYWYNYWGSPIGNLGTSALTDNNATNNTNNSDYNLGMLKKPNGTAFEFTGALHETGKISVYWLYTYKNGVTYNDWASMDANTLIQPGIGYTAKGTGVGSEQQYLFEGKPNNGTIVIPVIDTGGNGSVPATTKTDYLLGNPYPSALDIHKFIDDNAGVIDGTIQLWQQWSGSSHILDEYNGGYAQVNKTGATRAYQFVGIEGENNGSQDGTKVPTRYLPVAQGFMVEILTDDNVEFNNSQRVFIKESDADGSYSNGSIFFRNTSNANNSNQEDAESAESEMQKIRLEFNSVDGPATRRELLLGFSEDTTDDFDYGYDAKNTEVYNDDLNTILGEENYTIQAYSPINLEKEVPLRLLASGPYNYTISITEIENLPDDQEVYLKDAFTNIYHDLRTDGAYEFLSEAGEFDNRLSIVFQSQAETLSQIDEEISDLKFYYASGRKKVVVLNPNHRDIHKLEVVNMLGQVVVVVDSLGEYGYMEKELQNLSTGTYVISLTLDDGNKISKKIIAN